MGFDTVEYDLEEDELRATITLDRPEKMNALSTPLMRELREALSRAEDNDRVRAVVLTGRGDAFSAGFDLSESEDSESVYEAADESDPDDAAAEDPVPSADELLDRMEEIAKHVRAVWELNKPVIAAVNGHCLAGGSDLAMVCDIVIASEDATFGYPGQRIAGHPPSLTYPFFMGLHEAKELLLTGKVVDADRADEMGVFNRVVPADDLLNEAYDEVDAIKKVPGNGVRIQKHSLNAVAEQAGFSSTLKMSEFLDPLAHMMDASKEYYRLGDVDWDERMEWLNETDKTMRDVLD
jgi:enoyl-CoA hydratase/carnithine racemase